MSKLRKLSLAICAAGITLVVPAAAEAAKAEPALATSSAKLAAALHCLGNLRSGGEPVLLVHGTSATGEEAWVKPNDYAAVLRDRGFATCYVDLPEYALGEIPTSAEYVVAAVRTMSARAKR